MKKEKCFFKIILFAILIILLSLYLISSQTYSVNVTNEHPFLLSNGEYVPASELQGGMELKTINGKKARVTKITDVVLDSPVPVYNLETALYSNFILPGGVVVHNSNALPSDIPIPNPSRLDEVAFDNWVKNDLGIDKNHPLYNLYKSAKNKLRNNYEHIDFNQFLTEFKSAIDKFNLEIGDSPYIAVLYDTSSSPTYLTEIALQFVKRKPDKIIFIDLIRLRTTPDEYKNFFNKLFKCSNIRKFVIFDDASFSGSQISNDFAWRILEGYKRFSGEKTPIEVIAVLGRSPKTLENSFAGEFTNWEGLPSKAKIISGNEIKTVREVLTQDEYNALILLNPSMNLKPEHGLFSSDVKVADSVSVPRDFTKFISGYKDPVYKQKGTCFNKKWEAIFRQ